MFDFRPFENHSRNFPSSINLITITKFSAVYTEEIFNSRVSTFTPSVMAYPVSRGERT